MQNNVGKATRCDLIGLRENLCERVIPAVCFPPLISTPISLALHMAEGKQGTRTHLWHTHSSCSRKTAPGAPLNSEEWSTASLPPPHQPGSCLATLGWKKNEHFFVSEHQNYSQMLWKHLGNPKMWITSQDSLFFYFFFNFFFLLKIKL